MGQPKKENVSFLMAGEREYNASKDRTIFEHTLYIILHFITYPKFIVKIIVLTSLRNVDIHRIEVVRLLHS